MSSQIAKASQKLTTADEMNNQTKLVMQPYANWEEYLTPAPFAIATLGELVLVSSKTDFSINTNPPKEGYMYIKYPDSFRACIMELCLSGLRAISKAHKNMAHILIHTMAVPDKMKTALKTLFQVNEEVGQDLPDQLKNIHTIADDCLALAESTETRFIEVINIIEELKKQSAEEANGCMKKGVTEIGIEIQKAHETYSTTSSKTYSLPVGWDKIAKDLVAGLSEKVTSLINGYTTDVAEEAKGCPEQSSNSAVDELDEIKVYTMSAEILKCTEHVQQYVQEKTIKWKNLCDKMKAAQTTFVGDKFKRISDALKTYTDCEPKRSALEICEGSVKICKELAVNAPDGECEETRKEELTERIRNLTESARMFDSKCKDVTMALSVIEEPPIIQENLSVQTASARATEHAIFCTDLSRAQISSTSEICESVENIENNQKELAEVLLTMQNCKLKETDFNTSIEVLIKGMDAMERVKEQWKEMVKFFHMVSDIVKTSLTRALKDFTFMSEKIQSLPYNAKLFSKVLLYSQACQATNMANLIHLLSETYNEASNAYIMDQVSSLRELMGKGNESPESEHEPLQLHISASEAQEGILHLALKNKDEFGKKTDSRLEKIFNELLAILPSGEAK